MLPNETPVLNSIHKRASDGMKFVITTLEDIVPPTEDRYTLTFRSEQELINGRPGTRFGEAAYCAMYENEGFAPISDGPAPFRAVLPIAKSAFGTKVSDYQSGDPLDWD